MAKEYGWTFYSVQETRQFAQKLADRLQPADFLALEGDLGAGKTTFATGIARGLGITQAIQSPTFTIVKEYEGRLPLYHMDVYRVAADLSHHEVDEYFFGEGVCVVEWASLIEDLLPEERLTITLTAAGDDVRKCVLTPYGQRYVDLCEEMRRDADFGN